MDSHNILVEFLDGWKVNDIANGFPYLKAGSLSQTARSHHGCFNLIIEMERELAALQAIRILSP